MSSLPHVWKKCVLTCAALAVLTSGRVDGQKTVSVDIGENCLEYRYSHQSHCENPVPYNNCLAAASVGDCGIQLPFTLTSWECVNVDSDEEQKSEGAADELQNWHVICGGTVPTTPTVTFDIGEHCIDYRYSEQSNCSGDVPMNDCWAAQTTGQCGIKLPFTLSSAKCQLADTSQAQKWHVVCEGTVPSGPLPQPQCPSGHVLGYPGQDCVGSCTKHCDAYCIGGYCTGNYSTCYSQYQQQCDCGTAHCPCTGPNCD